MRCVHETVHEIAKQTKIRAQLKFIDITAFIRHLITITKVTVHEIF